MSQAQRSSLIKKLKAVGIDPGKNRSLGVLQLKWDNYAATVNVQPESELPSPLDMLILVLPFVEDALFDSRYKRKYVEARIAQVKAVIKANE